MSSEETHNVTVQPKDKSKIRHIWMIALVLGAVTAVEFIFAFTLERGALLVSIFISLTLVKAFYIVSEFMHLKHEVKSLIWSILIPTIFIVWLVIALLVEGGSIFQVRY